MTLRDRGAAGFALLLDENVSPSLARRLNNLNIDAYHVRDRGLTGAADYVVWHRAIAEDRIVVTINIRDFVRLAARSDTHPGVITFPSGCAREEQFALLKGAVAFLTTEMNQGRSAVNRWFEVAEDGSIRVHQLPPREQ